MSLREQHFVSFQSSVFFCYCDHKNLSSFNGDLQLTQTGCFMLLKLNVLKREQMISEAV